MIMVIMIRPIISKVRVFLHIYFGKRMQIRIFGLKVQVALYVPYLCCLSMAWHVASQVHAIWREIVTSLSVNQLWSNRNPDLINPGAVSIWDRGPDHAVPTWLEPLVPEWKWVGMRISGDKGRCGGWPWFYFMRTTSEYKMAWAPWILAHCDMDTQYRKCLLCPRLGWICGVEQRCRDSLLCLHRFLFWCFRKHQFDFSLWR